MLAASQHMTATMQQFGVLSRAPQRILEAQTEAELRETLGACLRGLFRKFMQFELFARGAEDSFVPVVQLGEGQLGNGIKLLRTLTSRLRVRGDSADAHLREAISLPAPLGVKRGPVMSAPLRDNGEVIGLVIIENLPGASEFTPFDLDILEGVAALFSLALQRLRAKETEYAQVQIERDLKSASVVQRSLMSGSLPPGIGVTSYAEYLPAFDVGGDFYDVSHTEDGRVRAVIGDVSGKGVTAALVMSRVLSELRRHLDKGHRSVADVLGAVNREMMEESNDFFATASVLSIDPKARVLEVASAGHLPIIVRRSTGQVFTYGTASGTPLGMLESEYTNEALDLEPGDIVLLMTDGLVEALDRPSDRMGMHLLLGLIKYAPHDPKLIIERSLAAVHKMKGTTKIHDDVTLVALQLEG